MFRVRPFFFPISVLSYLSCFAVGFGSSFVVVRSPSTARRLHGDHHSKRESSLAVPSSSPTALYFFGKVFEESGPLGKGITVGKVQVGLTARDRSKDSIFGALEKAASSGGSTQRQLASMAHDICLSLLRRSDDWVSACSDSRWFGQDDASRAESQFNEWANRESSKFEKEYIPRTGDGSAEKGGGATIVVVSLVIEIEGDTTKFDGAGYSLSGTKDVLSSVASDVLVSGGECVNAVEIFWTPGEQTEVLTTQDVILDFPELIDL